MTKMESLKAFENAVKRYGQLCKKNCSVKKVSDAWDLVQQFKFHSEKAGATVVEIAEAFGRAMATA